MLCQELSREKSGKRRAEPKCRKEKKKGKGGLGTGFDGKRVGIK